MLVSDSSPLIALSRIRMLGLLSQAYPEIVVPRAVHDEITAERDRLGARELATAPWLRVEEVTDTETVERLRLWLDRGESEAIVLAQRRNLPLAIDERRGRRIAASVGLKTTGTIGILLAFRQLGLVKEIAPLLDELSHQGFRLSRRLFDSALEIAGER